MSTWIQLDAHSSLFFFSTGKLYLSDNKLEGTIPKELGKCTDLRK